MTPDETPSEQLDQPANSSPVPAAPEPEAVYPICLGCHRPIEAIRTLEFHDVTLVFHTACGAALGTVPTKKTRKAK